MRGSELPNMTQSLTPGLSLSHTSRNRELTTSPSTGLLPTGETGVSRTVLSTGLRATGSQHALPPSEVPPLGDKAWLPPPGSPQTHCNHPQYLGSLRVARGACGPPSGGHRALPMAALSPSRMRRLPRRERFKPQDKPRIESYPSQGTAEETEAQRGIVTCPKPHSQ